MATAYQLVEMPAGGNNGPHQSHPHLVQHHLHHHQHHTQQHQNEHDLNHQPPQQQQQPSIDGLFAGVVDERTPNFYEPTPPPSTDYYTPPNYLQHVGNQHSGGANSDTTTASSGVIFHNASHLMANEDGYWGGSPCSSDSTGSANNAPTSPYHYAPVYYPPQYDRPEIVYGDGDGMTANYYGGSADASLLAPATAVGTGHDGGTQLSISASMLLESASSPANVRGIVSCLSLDGGEDVTTTSIVMNSGANGHNAGNGSHGMQDAALDGLMVVPVVRVVKRRTTANKKERRRTQSINSAFTFLRDCIPNVPSDTKLSKIKTLRLATSYISYLTRVLEGDQDPSGGFRAELVPSSRKINAERRAKYEAQGLTLEDIGALCLSSNNTSATSDLTTITKKAKSRTGWPQHVWASELKQEQ